MKILAFAGSNSEKSINFQLVNYASTFFGSDEVNLCKISHYETHLYSPEREKEFGIPERVIDFAKQISSADLILLSLAEHNGSYSAAFKNLYDWMSRIPNRKVFDGKPLILLSTSPGARGGASVMAAASDRFPRDGAELIGFFSLPSFFENFNETDFRIKNPLLYDEFYAMIEKAKMKL